VYEWFGKWLLNPPATAPYKETDCQKESDDDLRVFPNGQLLPGAMTQGQFIDLLRDLHRAQWKSLVPRNEASLEHFQKLMRPAWQHTLQLERNPPKAAVRCEKLATAGDVFAAIISFSRPGEDDAVLATYWAPPEMLTNPSPKLVVITVSEEPSSTGQGDPKPSGLAEAILKQKMAVLAVNSYSSGEPADQFANFYSTYNRTKVQTRVRDLMTVCAATDSIDPRKPVSFRVILAGVGRAGLWALLAAPGAAGVIADAGSLNTEDERAFLEPDLFCPGLLAIGGFETGPMLVPTHPLLLHNVGGVTTRDVEAAYKAADASAKLSVHSNQLGDGEIAQWLAQLRL
jgi:hypothetical protein